MRNYFLKFTFLTGLILISSTTIFGQGFTGNWLIHAKDGSVQIYKKGGQYFGKVLTTKSPRTKDGKLRLDAKNPDKSKRKRKILGLTVLSGFTLKGNELVGGKVYDSRYGKTYKGKIFLKNGKLMLRVYVGIFYTTREWTRIS